MENCIGVGGTYKMKSCASSVIRQRQNLRNARSKTGETVLHSFAKSHKSALVSYAIACGCEVDVKDNFGRTPLMVAVTVSENRFIIEQLLNLNANIYATNFEGVSVLRMVIEKSRAWLASLKPSENQLVILLSFFERVKRDFYVDKTLALQRLQSAGFPKALVPFLKSTQVRKYLFEANVALEERLDGLTPLHVAVMTQDLISVKMLIARGANVNAVDGREQTALFAHDPSASLGAERYAILRMLLNHGASLYEARDDGATPMEHLLKEGRNRTVWTVLDSKANLVEKCGPRGETALHLLVRNEYLRDTPREEIKLLLSKGLNVNSTNSNGCSALTFAIQHKLEEKIDFLLKIGAKVDWIEIVENTPMLGIFVNGYYERAQCGYYQWVVQLIFLHQGLNVRQLFEELNTGFIRKLDNLFYGQVVIAHLAIAESTGQRIPDSTLDYINSETIFKVHYDICKEKIEEMKNIAVHQSRTFYHLLIAEDHIMHMHVCNEEFLSELKFVTRETSYQNSYYFVLISKRIEYSIKIMNLRKSAVRVISECTGLNNYDKSRDHVLHKIVTYLSNRDIQNLFENPKVLKQMPLPPPSIQPVQGNIISRAIRKFFERTDQ